MVGLHSSCLSFPHMFWFLALITSSDHIYIGLLDVVGDNQLSSYKWTVDNSTLAYNNFQWNEPNRAAKRCVVLRTKYSFQWDDSRCYENRTALCEASPVSIIYHNNVKASLSYDHSSIIIIKSFPIQNRNI